ncbi:Hydroxyacid oxidase 2 [Holothuria leucospilota]|uniref:Hydroxyacid oxidase 2 n=1 Tax=Holothuria leucospilota TaxID=206669 RepID=A0A9Q1BIS8_HOLLE|nr:Hydroxyacid oxidase 2 [Holothuria leucospilota]
MPSVTKRNKFVFTKSFLRRTGCIANLQGAKDDIAKAKSNGDTQLFHYMSDQAAWDQSWDDIAWIRSITRLPVILKGIITDENAKEAVAAGVQGIIVSAHGGRQLDGVKAPIEALPEVVDAVRDSGIEIYMDGGVRSGRDIFKALALGAKAVFIGRPAAWGLAHNGTDGVIEVIDMMKEEFIDTMSLCGCQSLGELNRSFVECKTQLCCKL